SLRSAPIVVVPAAQALLADAAVTPSRPLMLAEPPGLGLLTAAHLEPFQCTIRVLLAPPMSSAWPAAQALFAELAPIAVRALSPVRGSGLVICDHFVPFQCRMSVWVLVPLE